MDHTMFFPNNYITLSKSRKTNESTPTQSLFVQTKVTNEAFTSSEKQNYASRVA